MNKFNQLSREEMRKVMGGSPGNGSYTGEGCNGMTASECFHFYVVSHGQGLQTDSERQIELDGAQAYCNYFCSTTRPV